MCSDANHSISVVSIYLLQLEIFLFSKLWDQAEHWGSSTAISLGYPMSYTYIITVIATLQKRKTIFCLLIFIEKEKNYSYHKPFQKFRKKKKKKAARIKSDGGKLFSQSYIYHDMAFTFIRNSLCSQQKCWWTPRVKEWAHVGAVQVTAKSCHHSN